MEQPQLRHTHFKVARDLYYTNHSRQRNARSNAQKYPRVKTGPAAARPKRSILSAHIAREKRCGRGIPMTRGGAGPGAHYYRPDSPDFEKCDSNGESVTAVHD